MSAPLLAVRALAKTFPDGTVALRKIDFEVARGEFLVVIGLSGSGKTTLLRCLNRLVKPTAGEIFWQGQPIAALEGAAVRDARREIAMIFQQFNLVPRSSALRNVLSGGLGRQSLWPSLLGHNSPAEKERARACLSSVGLENKFKTRADQLSGGQQQRVAIARALYQKPALLLADEPVASLDPALAESVMRYLQKANRELGITVICNLHFLSLVREFATRVIALRAGEVVFSGSPTDIDEAWFREIYGEAARDLNHV